MLAFLIISVLCFFALFFAVIALLRHADRHGYARALSARPQGQSPRSVPLDLPTESYAPTSSPRLPSKRPDWRFLARRGRRSPLHLPGRLPGSNTPDHADEAGNTSAPDPTSSSAPATPITSAPDTLVTLAPVAPISSGKLRSDWAFYKEDLGDLNDPYQAAPPTARRA